MTSCVEVDQTTVEVTLSATASNGATLTGGTVEVKDAAISAIDEVSDSYGSSDSSSSDSS